MDECNGWDETAKYKELMPYKLLLNVKSSQECIKLYIRLKYRKKVTLIRHLTLLPDRHIVSGERGEEEEKEKQRRETKPKLVALDINFSVDLILEATNIYK